MHTVQSFSIPAAPISGGTSVRTHRFAALQLAVLTATAAAGMLPATAFAADSTHCAPQPISTPTQFPAKSQLRNEHGTVRLSIKLNSAGRATDVEVVESSGHISLDRAAAASVRERWIFDVQRCSADELSVARAFNVQFQRAPARTLSSAIDAQAIARIRSLATNDSCDQSHDETGTAIFSCVQPKAPDKLAARTPQ